MQLKRVNPVELIKKIYIENKNHKDRVNGENAQRCAP